MAFRTEQLRFIVRVETERSGFTSKGTGVLLSPRIVVTCAHVIWPEWDHTNGWSDQQRKDAFESFLSDLADKESRILIRVSDSDDAKEIDRTNAEFEICLLYTSPSPRDATLSRMPSSA